MAIREICEAALAQTEEIFGCELTTAFGRAEAECPDTPPKIVVYPVSGDVGPSRNNGRNPVQMFTRQVLCVAEIWANDYDEAECLMNSFGEAMDLEAVTSWRMEGEEWDEDMDEEQCVHVVMRFRVDIPLVRSPRPTACITGWPQSGTIVETI